MHHSQTLFIHCTDVSSYIEKGSDEFLGKGYQVAFEAGEVECSELFFGAGVSPGREGSFAVRVALLHVLDEYGSHAEAAVQGSNVQGRVPASVSAGVWPHLVAVEQQECTADVRLVYESEELSLFGHLLEELFT